MCAPQAVAGLGPRRPRRAYGSRRRAMAMVNTKRRIVTALTTLIVIGSAAFYVLAQPASDPKKSSTPLVMGKRHTLAATLETVQWGWLDPKEPPKLTVD